MKSSGVLATLMLAVVAGYASAQCDTSATSGGATGVGNCDGVVADTKSCKQEMIGGTCTNSSCTTGTLTPGNCTANTWIYSAEAGDAGYACVTDAGTAAVTNQRTVTCTMVAKNAIADSECTASKPTDLTNTCVMLPATCASDTADTAPRVCTSPAVYDEAANCAGAACVAADFGDATTACCEGASRSAVEPSKCESCSVGPKNGSWLVI